MKNTMNEWWKYVDDLKEDFIFKDHQEEFFINQEVDRNDKHEQTDTEDEHIDCVKDLKDTCPILLWYMYNYIAGYLLLLIITYSYKI